MPEFELIGRIRARAAVRDDVILGIGDDAALLAPHAGQQLVATLDTLVSGVHFPVDTAAADIGWKSLAVNLSDLAAMGAEPAWALLALTLPEDDAAWLDAFLDGFLELAGEHRVALVGGDTTSGPLAISVQLSGFVPPGQALRRSDAKVGQRIWVTGTLGDAAAGLDARLSGASGSAETDWLIERLQRPQPRVQAGIALRGHGGAAIDISDGLLADLGHVCTASGVGADIHAHSLPTSEALAEWPPAQRMALQLGGGDDYELLFTLPAEVDASSLLPSGVRATAIGSINAGPALRVLDADAAEMTVRHRGYRHFGKTQ